MNKIKIILKNLSVSNAEGRELMWVAFKLTLVLLLCANIIMAFAVWVAQRAPINIFKYNFFGIILWLIIVLLMSLLQNIGSRKIRSP